MPTSVHIPPPLLRKADARAQRLGISRNRLIITALENELSRDANWSAGFFDRLLETTSEEREGVDELLESIIAQRSLSSAYAVSSGAVLVTANVRHMMRVSGLKVEDWGKQPR